MNRYAIIADDLTGAGDAGVQFARAGLPARVVFGDWETGDFESVRTLVVNTDSRARSPGEARDAVRSAAAALVRLGFRPVYKKVDSTLRGHPGAELEAILDLGGFRLAVVCPAFPANGRLVVGGYLLVDGVPVERTAAGLDPVTPVKESYLPSILSGETARSVELVTGSDVAGGRIRLEKVFRGLAREGGAIAVCDAASDADLENIARAAYSAVPDTLFTGSAGLAVPLAKLLADEDSPGFAPLLALVGSVNPVSRDQAKALVSSGWYRLPLDVEDLLSDRARWNAVLASAVGSIGEAASAGRHILITTPGERADAEAEFVAGRIAEIAEAVVRRIEVRGMILTGGDTAGAVLKRLGAGGVDLRGEVAPGIPLGTIAGGRFAGMGIVTKAGGFGKPDALSAAAALLAGD